MEPTKLKLIVSAIIAVLIFASLPFIGTTEFAEDDKEGLVIDFGYWEVTWTEMPLVSGTNAVELLENACIINGYELTLGENQEVLSIDGEENLFEKPWTLFIVENGTWVKSTESPLEVDVSNYSLLAWARANNAEDLIPGVDATGFDYYGYGNEGKAADGRNLRIISLSPTITEMIVAVGGENLLVGTDLYSNFPETVASKQETGEISIVGGFTDPNYEKIVGLSPDIVLCDESVGSHKIMADKLRKSGINCVVLYDTTGMERVYDNIWITASALGYSEKGRECIESISDTIDAITGIIGNQPETSTFITLSKNNMPYISGGSTYISDIVSIVKGNNVFSNLNHTWVQIGIEDLGNAQPESIILIHEEIVDSQESYDKIINKLGDIWKSTPAYKNGEIYIFSGSAADLLSRSGPRLGEASELIGKVLHSDQFLKKDSSDIIPKFFSNDYRQYLKYQDEVFF